MKVEHHFPGLDPHVAAFVGASITALLGLVALFKPAWIARMTSLEPLGRIGIAEIRATYGGLFLFIGCFALWCQEPVVFRALGWAWVGAAAGRSVSILLDGDRSPANLGGVLFEGSCGVLLLA